MSKGGHDGGSSAAQAEIDAENAQTAMLTKEAWDKELDILRSSGGDRYTSSTPNPFHPTGLLPNGSNMALPTTSVAPPIAPSAAPVAPGLLGK